MKKFFKVFLFILAFQMEVRVKASDISVPVVKPSNSVQIIKGAGAVLNETSSERGLGWTYVEGLVWFKEGAGDVRSLYGNLKWKQGEFWLETQPDRILVRNITAELTVTMRDGRVLSVPAGFQFWMGGLNSKGSSDFGMIQPVKMQEHLKNWASVFPGTKKEFQKEVQDLKEKWKTLLEVTAEIYTGSARRQIASIEAAEQAEKKRQEKVEQERQRRKELFFKRTFER